MVNMITTTLLFNFSVLSSVNRELDLILVELTEVVE